MGEMLALKAWYCDSTHRYALTDAVQPLIVKSAAAKRPSVDPKADRKRYYMLAHGCHLLDTARYFAGEIVEVDARLLERFRRLLLVHRRRLQERRARPSRPHRRCEDGLA